ncbi:MAG: type II toxin-antitoxin system VapC family toxin [Verrucomicrobiota bacterium]
MSVLVDTNVIFDLLKSDPIWGDWSEGKLRELESEILIINPVIFAEICFGYQSFRDADHIVRLLGFQYQEIPREGLYRASQAFRSYRKNDGGRDSILPDFFIGGHADSSDHEILTRDTKRYRSYFPGVSLISP